MRGCKANRCFKTQRATALRQLGFSTRFSGNFPSLMMLGNTARARQSAVSNSREWRHAPSFGWRNGRGTLEQPLDQVNWMISLHEKLSELSYGYGVTREAEDHFASVGLHAVPFFPSLLDEGTLGFDAAFRFDRPGHFLVLQFKLGEELQRFRRTYPAQAVPALLARPFWRFRVDLKNAQFRQLEQPPPRRGCSVAEVTGGCVFDV